MAHVRHDARGFEGSLDAALPLQRDASSNRLPVQGRSSCGDAVSMGYRALADRPRVRGAVTQSRRGPHAVGRRQRFVRRFGSRGGPGYAHTIGATPGRGGPGGRTRRRDLMRHMFSDGRYANVVATLALVIALAELPYAAVTPSALLGSWACRPLPARPWRATRARRRWRSRQGAWRRTRGSGA